MKLFPTERDRHRSDRRTVRVLFVVLALVGLAFMGMVVAHRLFGAWL